MIARRPVMKAEVPATIPASIVIAKAGLAVISVKIVLLPKLIYITSL
jgi:hypothetical protein